MKKVGILSTHRQTNWGSVLQCYALQEYLYSKGFEAEYIDYFPDDVTIEGRLKTLKGKSRLFNNNILYLGAKIILGITYRHNKKIFDKFITKNLKMTSNTFYYADEINDETVHEDIYCCGGDQVLNGFKVLEVFDNLSDSAFKVSYSSSFGKTDFTEDEWKKIQGSLSRFNMLSCREDVGTNIMKKMGFSDAVQVIDPVFLVSPQKWIQMSSKRKINDKYVFVYNLHHDKQLEKLEKELANKHSLKIYNVCNHWFEFYRKGKFIWCPEVEEFLNLLINSEYIISDSFHATAFAIIFHKRFLTVIPHGVSSRVESIARLFSLEDRLISCTTEKDYCSVIEKPIDYERIEHIIDRERSMASKYIDAWR